MDRIFYGIILFGYLFPLTLDHHSNNVIIITGDYTVIIDKNTGMVESMKLNGSDFELISDVPNYSLFFTEYIYEHPNGIDSDCHFPSMTNANVTTSIIYQDEIFAFIGVEFQPGFINSEWYYLFQEGKPWFESTITRNVAVEGVYSNFQQCTMYNPDVDNSFIINYSGDIELTMGSYEGMYSIVSPFLDGVNYSTRTAQHSLWTPLDYGNGHFLPTIAWSDNESIICMGAITTHTSANQRETISYHGGGSSSQHPGFAEAQWNWFGKSDSESMYLKEGMEFSMNIIFYQNISHIDSLFHFIESLYSDHYKLMQSENYSIASWGGRSSPRENYYWRFPQVSNNTINSQELWRHKAFAVPRSQIGTHDSQLFSLDLFYGIGSEFINVSPIHGLTPLFTSIQNSSTDTSYTGTMSWCENNIESELSFTAFINKHCINISGSIEKQDQGEYYIELELSPRSDGYYYYLDDNMLSIYSIDSILDTTAISLLVQSGIDSIDFSTSDYIKLYLSPEDPTFSIDLLSSIGHTIRDSLMWLLESVENIPAYNDRFILSEDYNIAIQSHSDYLVSHVDTNYFMLFVCNNFSELYFATSEDAESVSILTTDHEVRTSILNIDSMIQYINFPFKKNNKYEILLSSDSCEYNIEGYNCDGEELSIGKTPIKYDYNITSIYPNPFNPIVFISYNVPQITDVEITIFDITGKQIQTLINNIHAPGKYTIHWDATAFSNGLYIVRMKYGRLSKTQNLILLK